MQTEYVPYASSEVAPQSLDAYKNRPCALPYSNKDYRPPSPDEVGQLVTLMGWSQNDCAKIVGVSFNPKKGSPTVRRWKAPLGARDHRDIPYSAWRLMLIHAAVVSADDALKELANYKNTGE